MKYRLLADTGVFVSELCLGAMTFGGRGQMWEVIGGLDQTAVDAIVHRSLDAGINFIDTANVYSAGESETMVGKALAGRRQQVVLATKVRGRMGKGPNEVGLSRLHITQSVEASLTRLGTDYIDLYQIHRFDALTALEDTLRALDDLIRSGKVRYIGCSNLAAWQMMKALAISHAGGLERFRCTQSYYSLAGRELEREIVPFLKDQHLGLLVWSPLAGGFLSGKFTREGTDASGRRANFDFPPVDKDRAYTIVEVIRAVAAAHAATVPQIALAWLLAQDVTTSVIIGARRVDQLEDNLKSVDVVLTPDEVAALNDVSRLRPEYPEWMTTLPSDRLPGEERRFERVQR
jgi:aryl-alcohol dehydrogenase-like predicted oxidoreductase